MNFLKSLGLGLVIIILLPILLLGASLVGIVMIVEWIVLFIKGTVRFFKGDSFFAPLPEDLIVEEMKANELNKQMNPQPEPQPAPQPTQQNVYVTNYYQYPGQGAPNPQPAPQPNPYLNQQPYSAPAVDAIPERKPDFIDNDYQRIQYQENGHQEHHESFDISNEEGGNE